jgi:hypothetical protein
MSHSHSDDRDEHDADSAQALADDDGGVEIMIKEIAPNRHSIVATATFAQPVARVWAVFRDFEQLVAAALPGLTSDFAWLDGGGPDRVPSRLRFATSGTSLVEEVYHRDDGRYVLRYRMVEPALGILEYDAELQLTPISDEQTVYSATRTLTLAPGTLDGLAGLVALETQNLKDLFARPA